MIDVKLAFKEKLGTFFKKKNDKERFSTIKQYIKSKKKLIFIGIVAGIILTGTAFGYINYINYQSNITSVYHVLLDGQEIGLVDDKSIVETWQSQQFMKAQAEYGSSITLVSSNKISFKEETEYEGKYDNYQTLRVLNNNYNIEAAGVELIVDGKVVGIVKNKAIADKILNDLKEIYLPKSKKANVSIAEVNETNDNASIQVESISFKEQVETKQANISPDAITDQETMLALLQKGTLEERKYSVQKGDTISEIAVNFDLTTDQVFYLNPQLSGDLIHIGDELTVTAIKPMVTVEIKEIVTQIERIPYKVEYRQDSSMFVNEKKVIRNGQEGSKEVQYAVTKENGIVIEREVLNEEVLKEPVNKIYARGTKIVPVRGSGELMWPTVGGYITSYFGPRWGSYHNGLDISGVKDYTIKAADNGRVVYTGWRGGYGNTVMIDHGNGMVTLYGHMSRITVSYGDKVAKGQKIGVMGSTGNSTGIHLHFEVRVDGYFKNPLNYVGI